jgi:hypothetical protein
LHNPESSFDILPLCFLCFGKIFVLVPHWNRDGLDKSSLRGIYTISQIISHSVSVTIRCTSHMDLYPLSGLQTMETGEGHLWRPRHSKERMPDPKVTWSNSLQNDSGLVHMPLVLTLFFYRTVLPQPMHTIERP